MRNIVIVTAGLLLAQAAHAGPAGLPDNGLDRAYACVGVLYSELALERVDTATMVRMDRAAIAWLDEAARRGGEIPDEGTSNGAIDAASDAYDKASPDVQKAQLRYCLNNAPK